MGTQRVALSGVLSWGSLVLPNFQLSLAAKLFIRLEKFSMCMNVLEVVYHHVKFGGAWISPATGVAKSTEFLLSVCSSRLWTSEFVRPISPWRRWGTEMIMIPLYRGRFVVVHPCSSFSDCCQLATPQNAEVQKWQNLVFRCQKATDKPNEMKFGNKRIPWVCYSTPNLALIGKIGSVQRPQMSKIAQNCFRLPEADKVVVVVVCFTCDVMSATWQLTRRQNEAGSGHHPAS